jgi:hypothetical protein
MVATGLLLVTDFVQNICLARVKEIEKKVPKDEQLYHMRTPIFIY